MGFKYIVKMVLAPKNAEKINSTTKDRDLNMQFRMSAANTGIFNSKTMIFSQINGLEHVQIYGVSCQISLQLILGQNMGKTVKTIIDTIHGH